MGCGVEEVTEEMIAAAGQREQLEELARDSRAEAEMVAGVPTWDSEQATSRLRMLALQEDEVPGDENCTFTALHRILGKESAAEMRSMIAGSDGAS